MSSVTSAVPGLVQEGVKFTLALPVWVIQGGGGGSSSSTSSVSSSEAPTTTPTSYTTTGEFETQASSGGSGGASTLSDGGGNTAQSGFTGGGGTLPSSGGSGGASTMSDGSGNTIEDSCFLHGTMIRLAGGKHVPIEQVKRGDRVSSVYVPGLEVDRAEHVQYEWLASTDEVRLEASVGVVGGVRHGEHEGWVLINHAIKCTPEHPLLVRRGDQLGFVSAELVELGDLLVTGPQTTEAVHRIERHPGERVATVALHVPTMNTYYADGFVVHNDTVSSGASSGSSSGSGSSVPKSSGSSFSSSSSASSVPSSSESSTVSSGVNQTAPTASQVPSSGTDN